jgi:hypothetical protein
VQRKIFILKVTNIAELIKKKILGCSAIIEYILRANAFLNYAELKKLYHTRDILYGFFGFKFKLEFI